MHSVLEVLEVGLSRNGQHPPISSASSSLQLDVPRDSNVRMLHVAARDEPVSAFAETARTVGILVYVHQSMNVGNKYNIAGRIKSTKQRRIKHSTAATIRISDPIVTTSLENVFEVFQWWFMHS